MKIKIKKNEIALILSKVQGLTNRKTNLAITSNILIKTRDDGVSFSATDLETAYNGLYSAQIIEHGEIAVNASKLYEIVKTFPDEHIIIHEIENQRIKITCDKVDYNILGMNIHDFPEIPTVEDVSYTEIKSDWLKNMIDKTVIISPPGDEKRAHMTGVKFENEIFDGKNISKTISTDGRRLYKVEYIIDQDMDFNPDMNILIPKKGLSEGSKMLDSDDEIIRIGHKDNYFVIKKDYETMIITLLEGDFPPYQNVIKKNEEYEIIVNKSMFSMMLKRMSILSDDTYNSVIFDFNNNKIKIITSNPILGDSQEDYQIEFTREPINVAYNPFFFIETLNLIKDESIVLNIQDSSRPCIIEGINDKHFTSVIMPMSL
jgi:DNA polymerase-3 subunit beta